MTVATACACIDPTCVTLGCKLQRPAQPYPFYGALPPLSVQGCICPPGANATCENPVCPRKPPSSALRWPLTPTKESRDDE